MSNTRGLQELAETAHREVIAWYRGPNVGALTGLSDADRAALKNLGTLPIQVAIDSADLAHRTKLTDTYCFNSLIGQDTEPTRTRWSALVDLRDTVNARSVREKAREILRGAQQRVSQALGAHTAALSLDMDVVLPEMAALYVPPGSLPGNLWLPDTTIAMPRTGGNDGAWHSLNSFPADEPPRSPARFPIIYKG